MSNTAECGGSRDRESIEVSTPNKRGRATTPLSLSTGEERKGGEYRTKREDSSSTSNSSNTPSVFTFHEDHIHKAGELSCGNRESPLRQVDSSSTVAAENNKQGVTAGGGGVKSSGGSTLGGSRGDGRDKGLRVNLAAAHLNNMSTPVTSEGQWSTPSVPPHSPGALSWHGEAPTSSDKSSEGVEQRGTRISRKESYKAQRQHYRREKQKAASALLNSLGDPSTLILADWLKVRGSLKSWTKLWCVLKPGLLLLYKSPKTKSNHWVGTVLLSTCHVMERPSKKEGFCFKLYHPLEQGIWAPRGPHNEAMGAVVQPLPSSHLIFRAPSKAAGHCWLDGLELAQRCSNSLLRNSRVLDATTNHETQWSPEDMEKHFTQQDDFTTDANTQYDYDDSPSVLTEQCKSVKELEECISRWCKIINKLTEGDVKILDDEMTDKLNKGNGGHVDQQHSKILKDPNIEDIEEKVTLTFSDPFNTPILHGIPQLTDSQVIVKTPQNNKSISNNLLKVVSAFPKRRSSTPSAFFKLGWKDDPGVASNTGNESFNEISITKDSGGKKSFFNFHSSGRKSAEPRMNYSPYGEDVVFPHKLWPSSQVQSREITPDKFSLIKYECLPSTSIGKRLEDSNTDRHSHRTLSYVAGKIVRERELSESDSDAGGGGGQDEEQRGEHIPSAGEEHGDAEEDQADGVLAILKNVYVDEGNDEIVQKGEVVEELAEENKSLLWYLVKQVRPGMDLSRVALPTFVLEPRSFLDKLADSFYHSDILARAARETDAYTRMKTVVTWYLSGLYKKPKGLKKPYNPVLGEQFRCCWLHGNGTRTYYLAEQVSHHPPVSAFYVSNRKEGYTVQATILARSKFYGNSTSAILEGRAAVRLLELGEVYLCTSPYAHCGGLLLGTLSMELGGRVSIHCPTTSYTADIEFKLKPFIGGSDSINMVSGRIRHNKDTLATLEGHWDGRIDIKDKKIQEESILLDVSELKHKRLKRQLVAGNRLGELESQRLWSKVSEAINKEDQGAATEEKIKIEEAQRTRAREAGGRLWIPKYFTREPLYNEGEEHHSYNYLYNHHNNMPWDDSLEVLEYEEDFVIKSLRKQPVAHQAHVEQSASETDSVGSRSAGVMVVRARGMEEVVGGNVEPALAAALLRVEQALGDHKNTLREVVNAVHRLEERDRRMGGHTHTQASRLYTRSTLGALLLGCMLHWLYSWWGGHPTT